MKKWKRFMAIGLISSVVISSCMPQTMLAAEFAANNEFSDGADQNFEAGEIDDSEIISGEEKTEDKIEDENGKGEPEQTEPSDSETGAGEWTEGYTIQLYSDGKQEKVYIIPYTDIDTAKAPEALKGKKGYFFKEWNTKEDGSGESYKPGESIRELLQAVSPAVSMEMQIPDAEIAEIKEEQIPDAEIAEIKEEQIPDAEMAEIKEDAESSSDNLSITDYVIEADDKAVITLYAIWEKAPEYKITYKLNKGKNNAANPGKYTSEDEIKLKNPTRSGYHFVGWYTDSKYKNKVSTIKKGSEGAITLYAKWIKEVSPSSKAVSLNSVKGTKAKTITVSATVSDYVKSTDNYYYLVYVDSNSGKVKKAVAKVKKPEKAKGKITFKLDISGHPEYVQGKFAVGVKKTKSAYTVISAKNYVSNPEKLSVNTSAYYLPKTKKGIQSTSISEISETKSKTAFFNLFASDIMQTGYGAEAYKYNGKTYYFNGLYHFQSFVRQCNTKGIQVTTQISLDRNAYTQSLTTGQSPYGETAYYGWNTDNSAAREKMEATFAYLGEKFGSNDCYVSNWILGNEINSASHYYYVGNVSFSKYISMYSEAFRCLYNAVRSSRASSKVFICLDNCWNQKNIFTVCYTSKSTLDNFAANVSRLQKDVNWNLAYHAYSQPLTEAKFWSSVNEPLLSSDGNSATFITMHNIQALTNYVKNNFGSGTRVILSEQGFSSSFGGQSAQAASMALAYYKAACNPMIDAFIIRSYRDEAHEVAQGLALGLKDAKGKKKTVYNVFCNMDGSNSLKYVQTVLNNQVGNWKAQVPGYTTKKVSSMYRNS